MASKPMKPTKAGRTEKRKPASESHFHSDVELVEQDDAVIGRALSWSGLVALGILVCVGGVVAWRYSQRTEPEIRETQLELPKVRNVSRIVVPDVRWVNSTEEAGIKFKHENGSYGEKLLPETMGSGCAFLDYDSDGDQDLLLVNSNYWPWDEHEHDDTPSMALYANDGKGQFTDVTDEANLKVTFYGMGVAVGDYDNDGDEDLYFTAVGANHLFRNDDGRFTEVTSEAGVAGAEGEWSTSSAWFDYNNDGLLDLFVCNYVRWSRQIDLVQNFQLLGVGRAFGPPTAFEGTFPYLFRNEGNGKFTEVGEQAGLHVKNVATGVPAAKSMGVLTVDLNHDGWLDLIVSNDTVQNFLFMNQHNGTFEERGTVLGVAFGMDGQARGAMGIDLAHFRNDSTLGIAIGNFANEMSALYVSDENELQFVDAAISTGFGPETRLDLTFGLFFFDYDLDGHLDLFGANGHLEEEINKVLASQFYEQPPNLFWNAGPLAHGSANNEFVRVPDDKLSEDFRKRMVGRGAAFADIDSDGDLDVLITSSGGHPRLLRNDQSSGHHWLRVRLVGSSRENASTSATNRNAIGSWVEVHAGGMRQRRLVSPTRSYLSQCELPVTFGLGKADQIDKVIVHWPDGSEQTIETELTVDMEMRIEQTVSSAAAKTP